MMSSGKMYISWSMEIFDFAQLRNNQEEVNDYNAQRFAQQIAKPGYR